MSVALLIVGVVSLLTGMFTVTRREAIMARHRLRAASTQSPPAYVVMGGMLSLMGVLFALAALL